ncbi:MAG: glycosyltransferase [Planctomycetes bacterium]|nr:glycosyltransferase [Planctomycetota bacterium]
MEQKKFSARGPHEPALVEPSLTIVLALEDQAQIVGRALKTTVAYCTERGSTAEVIVVDDGSTDGSAEVAARWTEHLQSLQVVRHHKRRGRGAAARTGVLLSRGRKVIVFGADLAVAIEDLDGLVDALDQGADIAVASRALDDSDIGRQASMLRRMSEGVLTAAARCLVHPGVKDSFCGAHAYLRGAARAVAERAHSTGDGWAAEWLAIGQRLGLQVAECPVRWASPELGETKLRFLPTLAELVHAGRRLKNVEYLAPLPTRQTLADTSFVDANMASTRFRSRYEPH